MDIGDLEQRMGKALDVLQQEFAGLRTGRATPSLLDPIMVEAYGQRVPIGQLGSVTAPESRLLSVQVWDKSLLPAIEKAIRDSSLGLNPVSEDTIIRVPLPELTQERRTELVKVAHKYAEQARIAVRNIRRDGMDQLKQAEKSGDLSQDEQKSQAQKVQTLTDKMVSHIDASLQEREAEIRTI